MGWSTRRLLYAITIRTYPNHVQQLLLSNLLGLHRDQELRTFWENNPDLAETCSDLSLDMAIPYRVYGDGADSHRNQSFEAITLLPCLSGSSSTMDTRILVSVRNTVSTASSARTKISEVIAWSLCCLRPSLILSFFGAFMIMHAIFKCPFFKIGLSYHFLYGLGAYR